jgi:hypothetical protein
MGGFSSSIFYVNLGGFLVNRRKGKVIINPHTK